MAEYEKGRKLYDNQRAKKKSVRDLSTGKKFQNIPTYQPSSVKPRTLSRPQLATQKVSQTQGQRLTENAGDGLGLFSDVAYATRTGTDKYTKIYDSTEHNILRDILFVNNSTSVNLTFSVVLSRLDIDSIKGQVSPNKAIEDSKDTVYLATNMLLAQAGTAPSNPKQLSLSEIVGTTQKFISGTKPFYIYVYKTAVSDGILDVTVLR